MKKILSALLVLMILIASTTAFAIEEPLPFQGTFPFSEEPITLNVFNMQGLYTRGDFQDMECWKWLKEKTNIELKFESYTSDIVAEKLALKMVSNELPDLFFKTQLDNATVLKYAQEGIFIPITDYLEEYAPHFWYQLENDPSLRAFLTMSDGEIYGFNYIVSAANFMTTPVFANGEWMKAIGYDEVPADTEEFKQMLIKIRDADLNGNGEKDEVPLIATSLDNIYLLFAGAFGVNTRGRTAMYIDVDENNALRYIPTSEGYRNTLRYINELYEEGLLYQEIFDSSIANMTAVGEQNRIFMGIGSLHYAGTTYQDQMVGVDTIFKGPAGYQMNANVGNPIMAMNTFITCDNPHPAETVRLIDYFYSKEGVELMFAGFEGVTFERDAEGNAIYNDYVQHNPDGLINEEVLGAYCPWGGGANPSIAEDHVFGANMYTAMERTVCMERIKAAPEVVWGNFNYTAEDYEELSILENDINTYVSEMRAKFVTGDADLDADWDSYLKTLERMRLAQLIEIYQRGLDNYNKAAGL